MTAPRRIGIFAGTFDPIHKGHLQIARDALEYLDLQQVVFLVEEKPWAVKNPEAISHRKAMVELAILDEPKLRQFNLNQEQFSIAKTLPEIEKEYAGRELYFILGADVFIKMTDKQWPELDKLLKHYIAVFEREGIDEAVIANHARELVVTFAVLPSEHLSYTSSDFRKDPQAKSKWLPKAVKEYIELNGLYSPLS